MDQYDVGYYQKINAEEGEQADRLADLLIWKYQPKSVLDIGCATGLYLKPFADRGIEVRGVDYSESVIDQSVRQVPGSVIDIHDITASPINQRADLTICIEVLEHIPASGAQPAVKHIAQTADLIFFSAAQPGQGGVGHINCQPKPYWEDLFQKNNFARDRRDEDYLRTILAAGYHLGWLINNLMVFKPSQLAAADSSKPL